MNDIIIRVESLSKRYRIGRLQRRHNTLRDALVDSLSMSLERLRWKGRKSGGVPNDIVWALEDVSFEVKRGAVVGIIGRNGAGKSTLLKILSRITEPTKGRARIYGRIGSLLEVGTGFHPELTGRENTYMNGAILGMRRREIDRKFDEIVAFAEIEKFIDTPVKRYSSGMYVRLAFAVAAHLESEILLVDEVLAVGDAAFQKKCLGKMGNVTKEGRTVLFVSHNMNAIQRLCPQSMMLDRGQLVAFDNSSDVIARYLDSNADTALPASWIDLSNSSRSGTGEARFTAVCFSSLNEAVGFQPYSTGPLEVSLIVSSDSSRSVGSIAITLYDQHGTKLVNADTVLLGRIVVLQEGRNVIHLRIENLHLNPGVYVLGLWLANPAGDVFDHIESALTVQVIGRESEGTGIRPRDDGAVVCDFDLIAAT